jgi:microcystin-dependent protein
VTEPTTTNTGLIIPNTGDLTGQWGANALNPNFAAIDGHTGATQTISVSNVPITLTSPAGFTPTPSGGPTQAQNAILKFTGALTGNVQVTLPLPGYYIIKNSTTGNFVLSFRAAGSGAVIGFPPGQIQHVFNDGNNVEFANLGNVAQIEIWAGLSTMPAWVNACSTAPYLLCDGTIYNFSSFPALGARLVNWFGGNGTTTFGVPDLRGRVPLPVDPTGTRITLAGCGIPGNVLGSAGGNESPQSHIHTISVNDPGHIHNFLINGGASAFLETIVSGAGGPSAPFTTSGNGFVSVQIASATTGISASNSTFGSGSSGNVQPGQVTGIAVIRAA